MPKLKSVQRPIIVAEPTEPPPQTPNSFGPRLAAALDVVGAASCAPARQPRPSTTSNAATAAREPPSAALLVRFTGIERSPFATYPHTALPGGHPTAGSGAGAHARAAALAGSASGHC